MINSVIYNDALEHLITTLATSSDKSVKTEPLVNAIHDALIANGVESSSRKEFVKTLGIIDTHLGSEKAFEIIERTLIDRGYYSFAINCYLFLISRFKYNVTIAARLAGFVQAKALKAELSDSEWWLYCHAAYLTKNYESLSNVSAELRRRARDYERILNQYLMFDTVSDFIQKNPTLDRTAVSTDNWEGLNFSNIKNSILPLVACDTRYLNDFVLPKIASCTTKDLTLHIALADPLDESIDVLKEYKRRMPCLSYSVHYFERRNVSGDEYGAAEAKERRHTYYACLRFLIAEHILKTSGCKVLTIDADTTLDFNDLGDFADLIESASLGSDLALKEWDFNYAPGTSHEADIVLISPTKAGISFAKELRHYLIEFLSSKYCFWTLDQVALNACRLKISKSEANFRFYNLHLLDEQINTLYKNLGGCAVREAVK